MYSFLFQLTGFLLLNLCFQVSAKCPKMLPLEINGQCYRFETGYKKFESAVDNCPNVDENAVITSVTTKDVLDVIQKKAKDFVVDKLEGSPYFWMGLLMEDRSTNKAAEDRNWKWLYDGTEIVQKDYPLWTKQGGPTNRGLACTTISVGEEFRVEAVDCSGPKLPPICMLKEGEVCNKDTQVCFMEYGKYCVGSHYTPLPYDKMRGACHPGVPTAYKEDMLEAVKTCTNNAFLGGGIFMNMKRDKTDNKFKDLTDGSEPDEDWWADGEPRDQYDCVGLTFEGDWNLKLKTMNCEFTGTSLCVLRNTSSVRK